MRSAIEILQGSRVTFTRESRFAHVPPARTLAAHSGRSSQLIAFLEALPPVHQEALRQFYVEGQLPESICAALNLRSEVLAALRRSARSMCSG